MGEVNNGWLPIETAPKDGTEFYSLVDGLPYLSYFDELGRFIRVVHSNRSPGAIYQIHKINGKELKEEIKPAAYPAYGKCHMVWQRGFDHNPTHWIPLPASPTSDL